MSATTTQSELRLASLLDERDKVQEMHEQLLSRIEGNENKLPDDVQKEQIIGYRERAQVLDSEIKDLSEAHEANRRAMDASKAIRRALAGSVEGVEVNDDGIVYRTMAHYARDVIFTQSGRETAKIASQFSDSSEIERARERLQLLKRTPANTLSSNVGGLIPPQHISQIFQVINKSRPLVESGRRTTLERGTLTYPVVATKPVVAVQSTEKTEAGNTGMVVNMVTATASTYLGGGDLSWQAINWSTPDALSLWFDLAAADYALKTETDAATVVSASAFLYNASTTLSSTPTFAEFMAAVGQGGGEVYTNSGRLANTIYMAPDRFFYALGLTSNAFAQFAGTGQLNLPSLSGSGPAGLDVVISRGLNAGEIIVGDREGLLVAETAGAPVELRVVEPAIGGVEVGIIGAFEAVVVDPGAFSLITTAS